jgi:hypothetical protein
MRLRDLLPVSGVPRAENSVSSDSRWTCGDTREQLKKNGGHSIYDEWSITYRLNSLGYRCPEFAEQASIRMISVGCSHTYGVGLPQEALYHELFAARLRSELQTSVVNWNLGSGAVSNNYIARTLHLAMPELKPDLVLVFFTYLSRREYISATGDAIKYRPSLSPNTMVLTEICGHLSSLGNPYDDQLSFFRDYKSVEALLAGTCWAFGICDATEVQDLGPRLDAPHGFKHYQRLDKARDHQHLGPATHEQLCDHFWNCFVQSGGLTKVQRNLASRGCQLST